MRLVDVHLFRLMFKLAICQEKRNFCYLSYSRARVFAGEKDFIEAALSLYPVANFCVLNMIHSNERIRHQARYHNYFSSMVSTGIDCVSPNGHGSCTRRALFVSDCNTTPNLTSNKKRHVTSAWSATKKSRYRIR